MSQQSQADIGSAIGSSQRQVPGTPVRDGVNARRALGQAGRIVRPRARGLASPGVPMSAETEMSIEPSGNSALEGVEANGASSHIWGTAIDPVQVRRECEEFLRTFVLAHVQPEPWYLTALEQELRKDSLLLNIDATHIKSVNPKLYAQLVAYPTDVIPSFDLVGESLRRTLFADTITPYNTASEVQVRPYNLAVKRQMRELNPEDIETLVTIKGMIIRCGSVIPDMNSAFFQCVACEHSVEASIIDGDIQQPVQCANCNTKHTYQIIHNRCKYLDKQHVRVQETPDAIPEGDTPHTVTVHAYQELVDAARPGDRVEITAVYKAEATKLNPRKRTVRTVYKTYLDAVHIRKSDNRRLSAEAGEKPEDAAILAEQVGAMQQHTLEQIEKLAADPHIYDRLVRSIAPSIWELEDVKRGILCLLFGGANR